MKKSLLMASHSMLRLINVSAFVLVTFFTLREIIQETNAAVKNKKENEIMIVQIKNRGNVARQLTSFVDVQLAMDSLSHSIKHKNK